MHYWWFYYTKQRISYLGIKLKKYEQYLYKTLLREIKENLNKWRVIPCSQAGRLNIVKMSTLPILTYRLHTIPIKILVCFSLDIDNPIL